MSDALAGGRGLSSSRSPCLHSTETLSRDPPLGRVQDPLRTYRRCRGAGERRQAVRLNPGSVTSQVTNFEAGERQVRQVRQAIVCIYLDSAFLRTTYREYLPHLPQTHPLHVRSR